MTSRFALATLFAALITLTAAPALADEGNQTGGAVIAHNVGPIVVGGGGLLVVEFGQRSGDVNAMSFLFISSGFGPTSFPAPVGDICIDTNSVDFQLVTQGQPGPNGSFFVNVMLPDVPILPSFAPIYAINITQDLTLPFPSLSLSKTVRLSLENVDSHSPVGAMSGGRALHTATAFHGDPLDQRTRVLVTGGGNGTILLPVATNTTEIFNPLTRQFTPGPNMAVARALHTAVRLDDGRLLIAGGADSAGVVATGCEIYDPATNMFTAAASMNIPRAGHAMTLLPSGNVLVTGGLTNFVGGTTMLAAILNTAQDTAEIYDPVMNTWTNVPGTMTNARFGHAHARLNNGTVLISGGISGGTSIPFVGDVPSFTASCNIFDEAAMNQIGPAAAMPESRSGHQTTLLGNGDVLSTGGFRPGLLSDPTASAQCRVFNGTSWTTTGSLPTAVTLHSALSSPSGDVIVHGGLTGSLAVIGIGVASDVVRHDGTTATSLNPLGTNPRNTIDPGAVDARGSHTATRLYDGSILILGGTDANVANTSGYIYTE